MVPETSGEVSKSTTSGSAKPNLATQMRQVQQEERFDSLLQTAKQSLESDAGSYTGSRTGSKASSSLRSSRTDLGSSFKPAQLTRRRNSNGRNRHGSGRSSLAASARHITKLPNGAMAIYEETTAEPQSTAALDLQPL